MDSSIARPQSPLVIFGPDHIDTSRAEMLVQCLNDKIKEKRFKLQKILNINDEKKKRNEMMKNEKIQLSTKLSTIEEENSIREQQLQTEQTRIKELQFNIQMLEDHNNSIKRDLINDERKYDQEKSMIINKFEHTKQKWTEIFKPQYEQSKVYQYLKQSDLAYNTLVERKESLIQTRNLAYQDYRIRRKEYCNEENFQSIILSMAKSFLFQRDQSIKIKQMEEKLIELENKQKQLIESKIDKMKAWENVYTQPVKRDLMDFCLQANIDQALTISFTQIQQEIWSQPMTPTTILTSQNEQIELISDEHKHIKSINSTLQPIASIITIVPNSSIETDRSSAPSIQHLTTAIDDDDDELFSVSRRKMPIAQMEKMTITDLPQSTQAFVVSKSTINSNNNNDNDDDSEESSISQNEQTLTQTFNTVTMGLPSDSVPVNVNTNVVESTSCSTIDPSINKTHSTVTFQLPPPCFHHRPTVSTTSAIQPQVTSNDVQQMLLTFSPDPSPSTNEKQPQPMEDDSEQMQQQQQQRPTFSMSSSIESTISTEDGYTGFNYNFAFDGSTTVDVSDDSNNIGFTSPINFGNWSNLGSPITTNSNDQFSVFLQQATSDDNGVNTSFSFPSFNYAELNPVNNEISTDGTFGSFFFVNGGNPMNNEQSK